MNVLRRVVMGCFGVVLMAIVFVFVGRRSAPALHHFLYSAEETNTAGLHLYRAAADGSNAVKIFDGGLAAGTFAGWTDNGRWLYFVHRSLDDRCCQILRMHPNGTDLQQLTHDEGIPMRSVLSPDGQWLFYLREDLSSDSLYTLRRVRTDGGPEETLIEREVYLGPFSPDGEWLFYLVASGGNHLQPFRMRLDGTQQQPLTTRPADTWFVPIFAGDWRYFHAFDGERSVLYRLQASPESIQEVLRLSGELRHSYPALTQDAKWLALRAHVIPAQIPIIQVDGQEPHLVHSPSFDVSSQQIDPPQWAPASDWLLLTVHYSEFRSVVYRASPADGNVRPLTPDLDNAQLETVSPDGRYAIVSHHHRSADEIEIYRVTIEADPVSQHLSHRVAVLPALTWKINGEWSPDGDWFYLIRQTGQTQQLYRLNVESGQMEQVTHGLSVTEFMTWLPEPIDLTWHERTLALTAFLLILTALIKSCAFNRIPSRCST
jgi:hypothetical protein